MELSVDDLNQIGHLLRSHSWALVSITIMLWIYRALQSDSKFPIDWPANWKKWKPVVIIILGQIVCVTKAIAVDHVRWFIAVKDGVVVSFIALGSIHVLRLWWPNPGDEPAWLQKLVLVFNKVAPVVVPLVSADIEKKLEEEMGEEPKSPNG